MEAVVEVVTVEQIRQRGLALGLVPAPKRRRSRVAPVPSILSCTFNVGTRAFHVVYEDLTSADVFATELAASKDRRVAGCLVDEFRRGVFVIYLDGTVTSFSAEFPRYLRDKGYRELADARRKGSGEDLGVRVARRVKSARGKRGWSVAELARRVKMAAPNVHRIESGKHVPTMTTVVRLAKALDVPLETLLRTDPSDGK